MIDLSGLKVTEGRADFNVPAAGKPCQTYYKIIGDLRCSKRPLVALHGGPGVNHDYFLVLSDLTRAYGIPIVLYDQIGNGKSTHLPEKMGDTKFWVDTLFADELNNLLVHLDIQSDYDILGHSWGGMLGPLHAVRQPPGLKHLILMSAISDMNLWVKAANELRKRLPQKIQDILNKHELEGTTDSQEYQDAVFVYYEHFLCILKPIPNEIMSGFQEIEKDPTVYLTMNGPSEFFVTGTLKNWSIISECHKILVPTLVTNGRLDEAQDSVVKPYVDNIPNVKWVKFENSSHMAHHEERERFMQVVGSFLTE